MLQTILIPREVPLVNAIRWLKEHNYLAYKVDYTKDYMRFRQRKPKKNLAYYSIKFNLDGVDKPGYLVYQE